jgi:hypothetical protein
MTTSIDKWQAPVTRQAVIRAMKADETWAAIMEKQEKKIELETTRVVVNKRKEDFIILTTDTSNMDNEVKGRAHALPRRYLEGNGDAPGVGDCDHMGSDHGEAARSADDIAGGSGRHTAACDLIHRLLCNDVFFWPT